HDARVEDPLVHATLRREPGDRRGHDALANRRGEVLVDVDAGRVRADSSRVRADVAVEGALVILAGDQRNEALSVADREVGGFASLEEFLDDDPVPGVAMN